MPRSSAALAVILVMLAMLSFACCRRGAAAPGPTQVEWIARPCLEATSPPPAPPAVEFLDPCPTETCLDFANTMKLRNYLAALQRYAEKAWTLCGPASGNSMPEPEPEDLEL